GHGRIYALTSSYGLLAAGRGLRRRQAAEARRRHGAEGRRHDRPWQYLCCELYICQKEDHRADPQGDQYHHLLVIAENDEGYRNLVRITSEASLHGFYRKPRISKKYLAEHSKGLIGFSGCLAGELCEHLTNDKYDAARATAKQYEDIFGRGNFFLEIQDQGLELEKKIHANLFQLEKDLNIPL